MRAIGQGLRKEEKKGTKMLDNEWRHIGDGVYVKFDEAGFWLHANSHDEPTDRIYLEGFVMEQLFVLYKKALEGGS